MKTIIIGLGNTILSDDGVGPRVAQAIRARLDGCPDAIDVIEEAVGGLQLVDLMAGYDRAIIVDAIQTANGRPGQIHRLDARAFDATRHAASPHDVNFATALELARRLGTPLPRQIAIFAVEALDVTSFREECTPAVSEAIPTCVEMILQELRAPDRESGACTGIPQS